MNFPRPHRAARLLAFGLGTAASLMLSGCFLDSDSTSTSASASSSSSSNSTGNSGGGSTTTPPTTTSSTTLSGVAMAGPISGTVCAYTLSESGTIGATALNCNATTPGTGAYQLTWNNYVGNVILKAFGSYVDEATGLTKTIAEASALRSTVNCSGSSCNAAVTPLTEAAVRTAASLASSELASAYLKVAQAFRVDAADASEAIAKLVAQLPATSGSDSDALNYGRLLAVVSQAQQNYCGASCDPVTYLAGVTTLLGSSSGVSDIQNAMNTALAAWNSNPLNDTGVSCAYTGGMLVCNVAAGNNSGGQTGSGSSGNYRLTVAVTVQGVTSTGAIINHVEKPTTQGEFCNAEEVTEQLNQSMSAAGGSWTLNSCSFSGDNGTIDATVSITTPVAMSIPYIVRYTYSPM